MNYKQELQTIIDYVKNLRQSYQYLKNQLSPLEQKASQFQRILNVQAATSIIGVQLITPQQQLMIEDFLQSPQLHGLHMIYQSAIESLKYKQEQLIKMMQQHPDDILIAQILREVKSLLKEAENDYQHKKDIVAKF
jgi:hypothetical protein